MDSCKTRFAPSPTGHLHVGGARTALFSFVTARKCGGKFVLRIEDTDRARHDESAVAKIIQDLHWLGIEWDEGIEIGGPAAPYRQSERLDIYARYVQQLLDEGKAYHAFDTSEELEAMREVAQAQKVTFHYPRPGTLPTTEQVESARAEGRPVVVRFLNPNQDVTIVDEAFGEVTVGADEMDDFVIQKRDGYPVYHLAVVIDDALMGVNYIMRGQEFLAQSWRHKLLRQALGFDEPRYCHLPLIMDMKGRKLSKRDGDVDVHAFRVAGYLPEAVVNYIALLGWNPGEDREKFTMDELIDLFSFDRVGRSNPKFDRDKLLAFNTDAVASASEERLLECFADYVSLNDTAIPSDDDKILLALLRANTGFRTFADILAKCEVLFAADDSYEFQAKAVKKVLRKNDGEGFAALIDIKKELADCEWTIEALETWMKNYCESKEVGMGKVAQPIRVAVTGTPVSPQIYDTLVILGQKKTFARIDRCLALKDE